MGHTRKRTAGAAAAAAVLAAAIGAATLAGVATGSRPADPGVRGNFNLLMMAHTTSSSFGNLPNVNPWNGRARRGTFVYRSIPCTGNAPVNNISSNLPSYSGRVQGSRVPSSLRAHPMWFKFRRRDGRWQMYGRLNLTVCKLAPGPTPQNDPVPDYRKPKIYIFFTANARRISGEVAEYSGRFRILGGTQRYDDLRGSGRISGALFCFAPEGCRAIGEKYFDTQMVLNGTYSDPTPELAAG